MQVPTKDGWVFVNPYMTLVAAYERLIGARGVELRTIAAACAATDSDPGTSTGAIATRGRKASRIKRHDRKGHKAFGKDQRARTSIEDIASY